jgi:UDP-N-acetylmuramate dehydrogenase
VPLFLPHFNLQKLNTLAVPAIAHMFVAVEDDDDLRKALTYADTENLPLMFLGGGSNIVLRDDFPGLVIHIKSSGKEVVAEDDEHVWLKVAAGENWHSLVEYTLDNAFYGLENLSFIPGTVGAAPIQNIGAYGVEVKEVISEVGAIEVRSGVAVNFTNESCCFNYRDSIFKQALKDQYVITSVTFRLKKNAQLNLSYPALREALASQDEINPHTLSAAVIATRQAKLPNPALIPNVGSFFKNPIVSSEKLQSLRSTYPEIAFYPVDATRAKLAAGWLIDRAGWRGKDIEGVFVHEHQALVLTNPNKMSGVAVLALAHLIQESITAQFGVTLEIEPRIYP